MKWANPPRCWYSLFYNGAGIQPARGPFVSVSAAEQAFRRWCRRVPNTSADNPGARAAAGNMRIVGPYATRARAQRPDVNDNVVKNLAGASWL